VLAKLLRTEFVPNPSVLIDALRPDPVAPTQPGSFSLALAARRGEQLVRSAFAPTFFGALTATGGLKREASLLEASLNVKRECAHSHLLAWIIPGHSQLTQSF
jgi:hypothetical protein